MKKLITSALALTLVLCSSATAFAADGVQAGEDETGNVDVIVNTDDVLTVYSVDIEWDSLEFTYSFGDGSWNPADHTIAGGSAGWDKESANVKVTNHSNAGVNINALFSGSQTSAAKNGVTSTLGNNSFSLDAGVLNQPDSADNETMTVGVSGAPTGASAVDGTTFTVDTITLTVSAQ